MYATLVVMISCVGAACLYNRGAGFPWRIPSLPRWLKCTLTGLSASALAFLVAPHWAALIVGALTSAAWSLGHSDTTDLLEPSKAQGEDVLNAVVTGGALTLPMASSSGTSAYTL